MKPLAPMRGTTVRPAPVTSLPVVAYEYRANSYPWAQQAIAAAEAVHGAPPGCRVRPPRPCKCGCGKDVPGVIGAGRQAEYLTGHRPRTGGGFR